MGLGIFVGSLAVLVIGLLIAGFALWAGTTSSDQYQRLECSNNVLSHNATLTKLCSAQTGGMFVGIGSFIIAAIFIIVGFIATIISGVKMAVDLRKPRVVN